MILSCIHWEAWVTKRSNQQAAVCAVPWNTQLTEARDAWGKWLVPCQCRKYWPWACELSVSQRTRKLSKMLSHAKYIYTNYKSGLSPFCLSVCLSLLFTLPLSSSLCVCVFVCCMCKHQYSKKKGYKFESRGTWERMEWGAREGLKT